MVRPGLYNASQGLRLRRKRISIFFSGDMCLGKNTYQAANVRVARRRAGNECAAAGCKCSKENPTQWFSFDKTKERPVEVRRAPLVRQGYMLYLVKEQDYSLGASA